MFNDDDDDDDFSARLNAGLDYNRPGHSQTSYMRAKSIKVPDTIDSEDMDYDEISKNITEYKESL